MSVHGSKTKQVPILSYELSAEISDDSPGPLRWHNHHRFITAAGTFSVSVLRKIRLRDLRHIKRYGNSLYIGAINIDYEPPDFSTYMSSDGEMLDKWVTK